MSVRRRTVWALPLSLAFAVALAVASYTVLGQDLVGVDDANIYMAYGRNVAAGNGFTYYAGGERVEGFTSLAWTLITAAAYRLAPASPERVLFIVSILLAALTWCILIRFLWTTLEGPRARLLLFGLLFCAWCVSSPAYGLWMTTSLMETGLWSLTLVSGTILFARLAVSDSAVNRRNAAALAGIAVLVRPEALTIVPIWIATTFIVAWAVDIRRAARAIVLPAIVFIVVAAALTGFRLAYFGYPLPNTYYAKLSPKLAYNLLQGLRYLRDFAVGYPLTIPILAGCVALTASFGLHLLARRAGRPSEDSQLRAAAQWTVVGVSALTVTSLPLITGGDHFAGFRVVQPAWPLLGLVLLYFVWKLASAAGQVALGIALVAAAFLTAQPSWIGELRALRHEYAIATNGRALGHLLNEATPGMARPSVGVTAAGGIAVTYRGAIVDLMGLNNLKMGHSPGDRIGPKNHAAFSVPVFWELQPDLLLPRVLLHDNELRQTEQWLADRDGTYLRGLMATQAFRERYRLIVLRRPGADDTYPALVGYCRAEWIAQHAGALRWETYTTAVERANRLGSHRPPQSHFGQLRPPMGSAFGLDESERGKGREAR
jgi:hypothetical protein